MSEAELVVKALAAHLRDLADICLREDNDGRGELYLIAAKECESALDGKYGWSLELWKELKELREANEDARSL